MNKEQIGSFIMGERKKQGLSQKALAAKAGMSRYQQIIEIEKCQYDYSVVALIKVLTALGFDLTFVQPDQSVPPAEPVIIVDSFDFSKVEAAKEEKPEAPVRIPIYIKKVTTPFKHNKNKQKV